MIMTEGIFRDPDGISAIVLQSFIVLNLLCSNILEVAPYFKILRFGERQIETAYMFLIPLNCTLLGAFLYLSWFNSCF